MKKKIVLHTPALTTSKYNNATICGFDVQLKLFECLSDDQCRRAKASVQCFQSLSNYHNHFQPWGKKTLVNSKYTPIYFHRKDEDQCILQAGAVRSKIVVRIGGDWAFQQVSDNFVVFKIPVEISFDSSDIFIMKKIQLLAYLGVHFHCTQLQICRVSMQNISRLALFIPPPFLHSLITSALEHGRILIHHVSASWSAPLWKCLYFFKIASNKTIQLTQLISEADMLDSVLCRSVYACCTRMSALTLSEWVLLMILKVEWHNVWQIKTYAINKGFKNFFFPTIFSCQYHNGIMVWSSMFLAGCNKMLLVLQDAFHESETSCAFSFGKMIIHAWISDRLQYGLFRQWLTTHPTSFGTRQAAYYLLYMRFLWPLGAAVSAGWSARPTVKVINKHLSRDL